MKRKLLFITMNLYSGGAERSLLNLLSLLSPERYDIDLLLFKREGDFLSQLPAHVHLIDPPDDLKRLYSPMKKSGKYLPVKLIGTVVGRLKERKIYRGHFYRWFRFYKPVLREMPEAYDVGIAYLEGEPIYYLADFVRAKRKLAWIHNDYSSAGLQPRYDTPAFEKMDGLVTISDNCLKALREAFPQFREKTHLLMNISSAAELRRQAQAFVPEEYGPGCFNILSIGRLTEQKGFDLAIAASAELKKQGLNFHWYIIGSGIQEAELRRQIADMDVSSCFTLLGPRSNPYPYFLHADLLVQPSRWEGKSVVLDEAKMIGVPILCTEYPTARNQIIDGQDGKIVPLNAEGIVGGVRAFLEDERLRADMIAYQRGQNYDNTDELHKYERLFDGESV